MFVCTRGFSSRKVDSRTSSAQPDKYKTPLKGLNQQRTVGITYPNMQTYSSTAPRPANQKQCMCSTGHNRKTSFIIVLWCWTATYSSTFTLIIRLKDDNTSNCGAVTILTFRRRNYFFFNFSTPVYKMWIIQGPNMLELWNKLHFEKKTESIYHV